MKYVLIKETAADGKVNWRRVDVGFEDKFYRKRQNPQRERTRVGKRRNMGQMQV